MKSKGIKVLAMLVCFATIAQSTVQAASLVQINLPTLTLSLYSDNKMVKQYPIAAGTPSTQTIRGKYSIIEKIKNPTFVSTTDKTVVPPGEDNPLGDRWMRVTGNYGIHGNAAAYSIGTYASHGCMRMYNWDVKELFDLVNVGTKVNIGYETIETYPNIKYKNTSAIIVHPDAYNQKTNNYNDIMKKAKGLGITISSAKQKAIRNSFNYKTVSFASGWTVLVNNQYVTSDTFVYDQKGTKQVPAIVKQAVGQDVYGQNIYENKNIFKTVPTSTKVTYVQMDKMCNYFGIDFKRAKDYVTLSVPGNPKVPILCKNKKYYVPLLEFGKKIGQDYYNSDNDLQIYNMNIYYVKHKNKFLSADTRMIYYRLYVGIDTFVSKMGLTKKFKATKSGNYYINNKPISGQWYNHKFYADVDSLKTALGENADYWSLKKYVNFL